MASPSRRQPPKRGLKGTKVVPKGHQNGAQGAPRVPKGHPYRPSDGQGRPKWSNYIWPHPPSPSRASSSEPPPLPLFFLRPAPPATSSDASSLSLA